MRLKHGKKYETADGVVVGPMIDVGDGYFEAKVGEYGLLWIEHGERWASGVCGDLIRRHYTKPKPAHKLDLKLGDVVKLCKWEDGMTSAVGFSLTFNGKILTDHYNYYTFHVHSAFEKGKRPLFKVVSRATNNTPI
jgi:hypothetical protein